MSKKSIVFFVAFLLLPFFLHAPDLVSMAESSEAAAPETLKMWVTAYSSSVDETDSTPFHTALGTEVRDGIVATNMLPFGTLIKIPELFDDKVFVVEDRMHPRKRWIVDVWMESKGKAKEFGAHFADVQIVRKP